MPKVHHFSNEELDTCEVCNKTDLSVKVINFQYVCSTCNDNRCISCLKPVKEHLDQGLYCNDCADFILYSHYDDIMDLD